MNVDAYKKKFLEKYNPEKSIEIALVNSVKAAVQHNALYTKNTSIQIRKEIRSFWFECLKEIGGKFQKDVQLNEYEVMIANLKEKMNKKFGEHFNSGSPHRSEFRISHAQKSISIYVKYLWCMNLIEEPRICPVDRIILSKTDAYLSKDVSWGFVNNLSVHKRKFKYILDSAAVANLTVAKWELLLFSKT